MSYLTLPYELRLQICNQLSLQDVLELMTVSSQTKKEAKTIISNRVNEFAVNFELFFLTDAEKRQMLCGNDSYKVNVESHTNLSLKDATHLINRENGYRIRNLKLIINEQNSEHKVEKFSILGDTEVKPRYSTPLNAKEMLDKLASFQNQINQLTKL